MHSRDVMVLGLDPDPESDFQLFGDPDLDLVKRGIMTPIEVLCFQAWIWIQSLIFSLLVIPDPDSDPVRSVIVTPLTHSE